METNSEFRGKVLTGNEWVYGCLINNLTTIKQDSKIINPSKIIPNGCFWENFDSKTPVEVSPESVGQFSGLLDKNGTGNKVFVGDIFSVSVKIGGKTQEIYAPVVLHNGMFLIRFKHPELVENFVHTPLSDFLKIPGKVVLGNIKDTPQLLTNNF